MRKTTASRDDIPVPCSCGPERQEQRHKHQRRTVKANQGLKILEHVCWNGESATEQLRCMPRCADGYDEGSGINKCSCHGRVLANRREVLGLLRWALAYSRMLIVREGHFVVSKQQRRVILLTSQVYERVVREALRVSTSFSRLSAAR